VKKPARLDFRIVHPTLTPGPGVEMLPRATRSRPSKTRARGVRPAAEELFVKRIPEMTGERSRTPSRGRTFTANRGHPPVHQAKGAKRSPRSPARSPRAASARAARSPRHRARRQALLGADGARGDQQRLRPDHRQLHRSRGDQSRQRPEQPLDLAPHREGAVRSRADARRRRRFSGQWRSSSARC
jgi:hypothetical protein